MKHARIEIAPAEVGSEKSIEIELSDGSKAYLIEEEYTPEQLEQFESEAPKWIVRCKGSHFFLADSDSGEDATAYYCGYFDLDPNMAVFEDGKLVGFYLCTDGLDYSGRGRYNYTIDDWGFPGDDAFRYLKYGRHMHLFLFADAESHKWDEWSLLERDPEAEYKSYLTF